MKKFLNYPIYINHPGTWEKVRLRQRDHFVDKGDYQMMSWLDYMGKRLYEIMEDQHPESEGIAFERDVYQQLQTISTTLIGRLLFDSLDRNQKYWIIPLDFLDKTDCECSAYTFPGHPKAGGGTRIYYNPSDFNPSSQRWIGADDILFHELVHAYRMGSVGYEIVNGAKFMNDHKNGEEFFALQMQNMYLACRNAPRFYRTYKRLESVSKSTAYQYLSESAESLMALRHYTIREPLAAKVALWKFPADSFNPFRDYPVLERIYINGLGIQRLPAF